MDLDFGYIFGYTARKDAENVRHFRRPNLVPPSRLERLTCGLGRSGPALY